MLITLNILWNYIYLIFFLVLMFLISPIGPFLFLYWLIIKPNNKKLEETSSISDVERSLNEENKKLNKHKLHIYIPIFFALIFIYFSVYYVENPPVNLWQIPRNYFLESIFLVLPICMGILSTLIYSGNYIGSLLNSLISVAILINLYISILMTSNAISKLKNTGSIGSPLDIILWVIFFFSYIIAIVFILTLIGSSIGYVIKKLITKNYKK